VFNVHTQHPELFLNADYEKVLRTAAV
jgi:hypothetical protein